MSKKLERFKQSLSSALERNTTSTPEDSHTPGNSAAESMEESGETSGTTPNSRQSRSGSPMSSRTLYEIQAGPYGGYDVYDSDMYRLAWTCDLDKAKAFVNKVLRGRIEEIP